VLDVDEGLAVDAGRAALRRTWPPRPLQDASLRWTHRRMEPTLGIGLAALKRSLPPRS